MVPEKQNILIPLVLLVLSLLGACTPEQKRYVPNAVAGDVTPTMSTTDVNTFISDSGYTRYHLETPVWQIFDDADDPFWRFPEGLRFEQFDRNMKQDSQVTADSATYFSRRRLMRLDGHVVMINARADSFLTQQIFWDQERRRFYTDSFIHIVSEERIIEGYGMESDQSMNYFTVRRPTAILPAHHAKPEPNDEPEPAPAPQPKATPDPAVQMQTAPAPSQGPRPAIQRLQLKKK